MNPCPQQNVSIGEAASKVSRATRSDLSTIPWQDITDMRNRLVHAYFDINLNIVWHTVTEELPALTAELERVVLGEQHNEDPRRNDP